MAEKVHPARRAYPASKEVVQNGVTVREYVAARALQGVIGASAGRADLDPARAARQAVDFADALIRALHEKGP